MTIAIVPLEPPSRGCSPVCASCRAVGDLVAYRVSANTVFALCPACRSALVALLVVPAGERRPSGRWRESGRCQCLDVSDHAHIYVEAVEHHGSRRWWIRDSGVDLGLEGDALYETLEAAQLAAEDAVRDVALGMLRAVGGEK